MTDFPHYQTRAVQSIRSGVPDPVDAGFDSFSERHSRVISGIIKFCCSLLIALLLLSTISFFSLRPTLKEVHSETRKQWENMLTLARERNDLVPGMVETLKGVGLIQNRLGEKMIEERSILSKVTDPSMILRSIEETDQRLAKISQFADSSEELKNNVLFQNQWSKINYLNKELKLRRAGYNETTKLYNSLLTLFPQNMIAAIFGFVPLNQFPSISDARHATL